MPGSSYEPHHILLRDAVRTQSFRRAIAKTIRPGDVVLDLGAGSGILSLFAAKAGASRIFAVELDEQMCALVRSLAIDNGFGNVVEVICARSQDVSMRDPVDVLISDAMGFFGISEEMEAFFDARARFARQDARLIPQRVELYAAPASVPDVYEWLDIGRRHNFDVDLSAAGRISLGGVYSIALDPEQLLAPPRQVASFDMRTATDCRTLFDETWVIGTSGQMHGLVGWCQSRLADNEILSSGPFQKRVMGRSRFFPLPDPVQVSSGATIGFRVHISPTLAFWSLQRSSDGPPTPPLRFTSLSAHPAWRSLGLAPGDLPEGLEELCFSFLYGAQVSSRNAASGPSQHRIDRNDLERIVRDVHAGLSRGVFTGI
jgi:precorrin-6B methylase 2